MTIFFLLAAILIITTPVPVFFWPHGIKRLKGIYIAILVICMVVAFVTTFLYVHSPNENTRVHGWPVPLVIFQRDGPNAPWLDFVGPTPALAYPINLILYLCLPSFLILVVAFCKGRSHISKGTDQASDTETW